MNSVYVWFGGRSTAFALWFFVVGVILAYQNKLSVNYIALAGALQTLIATRSIAGDRHERSKVVIPGPMGPAGVQGPPGRDGVTRRATGRDEPNDPKGASSRRNKQSPSPPEWHDS